MWTGPTYPLLARDDLQVRNTSLKHVEDVQCQVDHDIENSNGESHYIELDLCQEYTDSAFIHYLRHSITHAGVGRSVRH